MWRLSFVQSKRCDILIAMFTKDILVMDFEGGKGPKQIGLVLLDKDTLVEKASFSSYIYFDMQGVPSMSSGITQDMLDGAPHQKEVGKKVFELFGADVLLASWIADFDHTYFKMIMKEARVEPYPYDYHFLDIWAITYAYLVKKGYTGSIRSDAMFAEFGVPQRGNHDALEDARIAGVILRTIMLNNT